MRVLGIEFNFRIVKNLRLSKIENYVRICFKVMTVLDERVN